MSSTRSNAALRVILFVLLVTEINSAFEVGMMYGILATLVREYGDPAGVGWLITAFLLVGAAAAALCSRLGDIYGRRRVVLVMLVFAACGSLVSALSTSLPGLILGRALQGVAAALLPLCIGLAREYFPAARVPVAIGWLAAVASFSAAVGILFGGWLADNAGWRMTFWIGAGHAVLSLVCVLFLLPPSKSQARNGRLDVLGGVLFAPAIAAVLLAITRLKGSGWTDPFTLALAAGGIVLLVVWARREWNHPDPMLDVRQFAQRQIGLTMLLMALFGLGTAQLMLVVLMLGQQPVWTGVGLGLSATLAAMVKVPSSVAGLVGAPWSGHMAARYGARRAALVGAVVICASWVAMMAWHATVWQLVVLCFVATVGGAILYAAIPNLVVEVAPAERTSELNGMSHVLRTLGTAIGTQLVSVLLATSVVRDPSGGPAKYPTESAYLLALGAVSICAALSILVVLALPKRQAQTADDKNAVAACGVVE
ncbi:MFS transporter [Ramlibacter sp. WS9]|uniref:MFS transporter n=1 Tax=Ramlibacter sp. WS9 TaxID=1882741 RepID=UPI0011435EEC|nr:MFS transporter [Ramlibacter sp. WS9]ROZ69148.1 MFS transporter [Ramlibacter sp. WS9]